jgi:DNA polymerase III sliding clamp (beta) subunit (PCNA family)
VLDRIARSRPTGVLTDGAKRVLRFTGDQVTITTRLVANPFPTVDGVLAAQPPAGARLNAPDMRAAVARLVSGLGGTPIPVRIRIDDTQMTLRARNEDVGSGAESVAVIATVPAPFETAVASNYLSDAVAALTGQVTLSWSAAMQPLYFSTTATATAPAVTLVVMPVRL